MKDRKRVLNIMLKYQVVSDSMMPLIPIGSEITIKKIQDVDRLKKFDIIVFKSGNLLMCHYYWHQNQHFDKGMITTRALKSGGHDIPFDKNKILGIVTNFKLSGWMKISIIVSDYLR